MPDLATNWSGHLDFLKEENGFIPLDFEMVEIPECQVWQGIIDKGAKWAKVKEDDVKKRLRKFVNSPSVSFERAKNGKKWVEENFGKPSVSQKWKDFFATFIKEESASESNSGTQMQAISAKQGVINKLSLILDKENVNPKVLYIMPRSAGDVLLSTAIVASLIKHRHPTDTYDWYFATTQPYKDLLSDLKVKVVEFQEEMMHSEVVTEVWDYVYNPGVNVQYNFSNWLLGNGEYSVRLLEEFAKNCNLTPFELSEKYVVPTKECTIPDGAYIAFCPGGEKTAKVYKYWDDVVSNLKEMLPGVKLVQTGLTEEKLYDGVVDFRGKNYAETAYMMKHAIMCLATDTFGCHLAASLEVPHVVIYGSTHASAVSPVVLGKRTLQVFLESSDRHGCKNPCYKNECTNKVDGKNCLSEISALSICDAVMKLLQKEKQRVEAEPKVAEEMMVSV